MKKVLVLKKERKKDTARERHNNSVSSANDESQWCYNKENKGFFGTVCACLKEREKREW